MTEIYETAMAQQAEKDRRAAAEQQKADEEKRLIDSEQARLDEIHATRERKEAALAEFKPFVKDVMLQYVIENLMEDAIAVHKMTSDEIEHMHRFTKSFIQENGGADRILAKAASSSEIVHEIDEEICSKADELAGKCDKDNPETFQVKKEDIQDVINNLSVKDDFSQIKQVIADRVANAEGEFVNSIEQDKAAIDDTIAQAEEKITNVNSDQDMSKETKEAIANEVTIDMKQKINAIRENKNRGIFDEMVHRFAKTALKNESLHEEYLTETGSVDMERVVSSVRMMYSILETFSTTRLYKIDEAFIKTMLDEM